LDNRCPINVQWYYRVNLPASLKLFLLCSPEVYDTQENYHSQDPKGLLKTFFNRYTKKRSLRDRKGLRGGAAPLPGPKRSLGWRHASGMTLKVFKRPKGSSEWRCATVRTQKVLRVVEFHRCLN
jgi:hypothetical protein